QDRPPLSVRRHILLPAQRPPPALDRCRRAIPSSPHPGCMPSCGRRPLARSAGPGCCPPSPVGAGCGSHSVGRGSERGRCDSRRERRLDPARFQAAFCIAETGAARGTVRPHVGGDVRLTMSPVLSSRRDDVRLGAGSAATAMVSPGSVSGHDHRHDPAQRR
ncbi:hypothetical protein BVRB_027480, partial [Beta vulgaris subsp. vulgaris]